MARIAQDSNDNRGAPGRLSTRRLGLVRTGEAPPPGLGGQGSGRLPKAWAPLLILAYSALVLALAVLDAPARAVPVLAYVAVVPGLAWMRLIRIPDLLTLTLLGIALSLALGIVVTQAMITLRGWSPLLGLSILVGIASVAAVVELWRGPSGARRPPSGRGE